ncbi:MAG TPA: hypothetical protein VH458_16520 [Vicinamibacterales bacterium]
MVALTLPREVIESLQASHSDLGWAIVKLVEKTRPPTDHQPSPNARLAEVGAGASLIVVDPAIIQDLPAVRMVPLSDHEAFLALAPGQGMADLELAVIDQVERLKPNTPQRRAAESLRDQLRAWRLDRRLRFESRSIVLVTKPGSARRS